MKRKKEEKKQLPEIEVPLQQDVPQETENVVQEMEQIVIVPPPVSKEVKTPAIKEQKEFDYDPVLRWKKIGGNFHLKDKIIKSGEIFKARPSEIKEAFRDVIACLEPERLKEVQSAKMNIFKVNGFVLKSDDVEHDKFNVFNENTGKKITSKALTKTDAEELVKVLML